MEREKLLNDLLVMLFNEVLDMENRALITGSFKEISINDMQDRKSTRLNSSH